MSSVCYKLPVCSEATLSLPVFPKCTQSTLFSLAQYPWFSFCTFPRPFIPLCHDLLGTIFFCFSLLQKPTHTSSLDPTFSQQVLTTKEESTNQIPIDRPQRQVIDYGHKRKCLLTSVWACSSVSPKDSHLTL